MENMYEQIRGIFNINVFPQVDDTDDDYFQVIIDCGTDTSKANCVKPIVAKSNHQILAARNKLELTNNRFKNQHDAYVMLNMISDYFKISCSIEYSAPFFVPWCGDDYKNGIQGKKLLVIGASHNCPHSDICSRKLDSQSCLNLNGKKCKLGCKYFEECTSRNSRKFAESCPNIEYSTERYIKICNYKKIKNNLCSTTIGEICDFIAGGDNKAYTVFSSHLNSYFGINDIWERIAFSNFAQNFQPNSTGNRFFEDDFPAFIQNIYELAPDVVIVWGDVGSYLHDIGFKTETVSDTPDDYIWKRTLFTCEGKKTITFLHSYHPSYGGYMHKGKLNKSMDYIWGK